MLAREQSALIREISTFYEDTSAAYELLSKAFEDHETSLSGVEEDTHANLQKFRDSERELFERRLRNQIPRTLVLLEIALDSSPIGQKCGHSDGAPAYQAEMYYRG